MTEHLLQGGEVFEITDYTTASEWEKFIAHLEETLTEWDLNKQSNSNENYKELTKGSISCGFWKEKRDVMKFGNVTFDLRYQYLDSESRTQDKNANESHDESDIKKIEQTELKSDGSNSPEYLETDDQRAEIIGDETNNANGAIPIVEEKEHGEHELPDILPDCLRDLVAPSNDFASKAHCLVRWYNLRGFIILSPRADTIVSKERIQLLLSSASVALANIDCHIPFFVQTHNPKNNFYQGISEHLNIRTMYEMVFFRKSIKQYSYLSELIGLFREKSGCTLGDPISVTVRLNYCLDYFDLFVRGEFTGNEHLDDDQDELVKMTSDIRKAKISSKLSMQDMRSGASFEQVTEALEECMPHPYKILRFLHVAALWPPVSDKVITDNQVHSDLDPSEAPIWTMRCVTKDNCNIKIVHETQAINELLCSAVDYAYERLDAETAFTDYNKETLKARCLRLSYDLSIKPEIVLSETPSDSIRKLVALIFYRAAELTEQIDALDQIAGQVKKKPSLSEIYRTFSKKQRPSVKEFIIRSHISRPFIPNSTPALPQRMFCSICEEEFRLCGAFSELCN